MNKNSLSNSPKTSAELEAKRGGLCCKINPADECIGCERPICSDHTYYIARCWDCKNKQIPNVLRD